MRLIFFYRALRLMLLSYRCAWNRVFIIFPCYRWSVNAEYKAITNIVASQYNVTNNSRRYHHSFCILIYDELLHLPWNLIKFKNFSAFLSYSCVKTYSNSIYTLCIVICRPLSILAFYRNVEHCVTRCCKTACRISKKISCGIALYGCLKS